MGHPRYSHGIRLLLRETTKPRTLAAGLRLITSHAPGIPHLPKDSARPMLKNSDPGYDPKSVMLIPVSVHRFSRNTTSTITGLVRLT